VDCLISKISKANQATLDADALARAEMLRKDQKRLLKAGEHLLKREAAELARKKGTEGKTTKADDTLDVMGPEFVKFAKGAGLKSWTILQGRVPIGVLK
jgi:hypothetical protein